MPAGWLASFFRVTGYLPFTNIQKLLNNFMTLVGMGEIEIYNEFSLREMLSSSEFEEL